MATKKQQKKKQQPKTSSKTKPKAQPKRRTKRVKDTDVEIIKLTPKQEKFCQLYATEIEFFGNGVQSYIEAYNVNTSRPGAYSSASSRASQMLTNINILERIDQLLEQVALNDQHVDKQLAFWIRQKASPQAAIAAIREYNALKQRVIKKIDATLSGDPAIALVRFVGEDDDEAAAKRK